MSRIKQFFTVTPILTGGWLLVVMKNRRRNKEHLKTGIWSDRMGFLVEFLNRDFDQGSDEPREREQLRCFRDRLLFFELLPLIATEPYQLRREQGKLQIFIAADWSKTTDPGDAWRALLRDIENADLRFTVLRQTGEVKLLEKQYKRDAITGGFVFRKQRIVKNEALGKLGRDQRIVSLPCGKFIFKKQFTDLKTTEQRIYARLVESLENGEFENLRLCTICHKFFLKAHGNQKYCPGCTEEAEKRNNRTRQSRHRDNKKLRPVLKRSARNGDGYPAARRLFEEAEKLFARRAKLITKDKDRLVQIRHRITHWPDFGNLDWNQLTAEAQKEWNRAAQMIG